tara:strand:+ start:323 stop:700 length:378 start_codon:yes stop_codon:yes gene_type:complete
MGKELDKNMLRMMTITERFKYMNDLKKMRMNISQAKDEAEDNLEDPDVQEFLEQADKQGPWSEEDDKIFTVGGLTADKDQSFKAFQEKQNKNTQSWVDEEESEYDNFSDGGDSSGGEDYDDSNEY